MRRQLTLFVDPANSKNIEEIRSRFNARQKRIIESHVTLCRKDELANFEQIAKNLQGSALKAITLNFGKAVRFYNGNGVLMPVIGHTQMFYELKNQTLKGVIDNPRRQEPHITLMHPRNSLCTDNIFEQILQIALPGTLTFNKISLIEQEENKAWKILEEFELE